MSCSAAVTLPHHDVPPGSPAPTPLSSLRLANYLAALERDAADIASDRGEAPVILGHSMGGILAQLLAERVQPKGLILLSSAPSMQASATSLSALRTLWGITGKWGWWNEATLLDEEAARFGVFNGVPEAEIRPALTDLTWDSGPVLAQLAAPFLDPDKGSRVDYTKLKMPTLVITGLEDRIV